MLSSINCISNNQICREPKYDRNEKDDLKLALDYLFEFKEKLNNLHPNVLYIIEKLLQSPHIR